MDQQELLALLGYQNAPAADPEVDAVSGDSPFASSGPAPAPDQGYGQAGINFTPKTYDFGNQGAKQMEYDQQGNLQEVLPGGAGKIGVSQDRSGFSSAKLGQIEAGPMGSGKMAKGEAGLYQQSRDRYANLTGRMEQANAAQLAAEDQAANADADAVIARAAGQGKIASLMQKHAGEFRHLNESTLLAKQTAKDEYRQKLLEIPEVNPNALWDEAGASGQFQMSVAAFVHDMLGVKGIKTSAMDTINGAIRNKIDAQIANINMKRQVASGFKDLYDMTVAESGNQMEVQAKMHGYMLKAMEAGIDADMGKIDSNVARATHQQAKMVLRQAQLKNMVDVEKHIDDNFDKAAQRQIQIRGQNLQASMAKERNAVDLQIAEARNKAQAKQEGLPPVIFDTTVSGKGAAKWRIRPELAKDNELVRGVINKTVSTGQALEGLRELQDLQKSMGSAPPDQLGRIRNEINRREQALRDSIVMALVLDQSGKQVTDKEREHIQKLVPSNDWFTNGSNRRIISQLVESKGKEMNRLLQQTTNDIKPGDEAYGTSAAQNQFGAGEMTEANLIKTGQDEHAPGVIENLSKQAQSPDAVSNRKYSDKFEHGDGSPAESEYKNFTLPYWKDFSKSQDWVKQTDARDVTTDIVMGNNPDAPPRAFDAIRELAEMAHAGDGAALIELRQFSTPQTETTNNARLQAMANYFLKKMDTDETSMGYPNAPR